ncbi:hypothetical protein [Aquibacillus sediminis]|uniref:hypothetical protein n=1 Tax=Aquibacillus sediminis TaxID=2574734 RepID=UPI001108EB7C|nr:hypothetical protein [Aquibacillus sediminis]
MVNVAIYYQLRQQEKQEHAIKNIDKMIQQLEVLRINIKGVFIDGYNSREKFEELISLPLDKIDYIYINKTFEDEFDNRLINELSKSEQFKLKLFYDFI